MFSIRLKMLRTRRKLSQRQLAEILGVTQGTIAHLETDRKEPSREMLIKAANYFDCTIDFLLGRTDTKNTSINNSVEEDIQGEANKTNLTADEITILKKFSKFLNDLKSQDVSSVYDATDESK